MKQNISYKTAKNLSLGYAIFAIISLFFNTELIGNLLFLVVFPFLMIRLKRLIAIEYDFQAAKLFFSIAIFVTIISTIVPYIGSAIISTVVDISTLSGTKVGDKIAFPPNPYRDLITNFARLMELLLILRGISFLALSGLLIRRFKEFCISLRVTITSFILFGIRTVIMGLIGIFPMLLQIFTHETVMISLNIIKLLIAVTLILMFGSMFLVFGRECSVKENENLAESCE